MKQASSIVSDRTLLMLQLVLVQVLVLVLNPVPIQVLDLSGPTWLRCGLRTFFVPASVHV